MKALAAGKHVLLEKPSADTAEETKKMFDFAREKGLVLLEAGHYRSVVCLVLLSGNAFTLMLTNTLTYQIPSPHPSSETNHGFGRNWRHKVHRTNLCYS